MKHGSRRDFLKAASATAAALAITRHNSSVGCRRSAIRCSEGVGNIPRSASCCEAGSGVEASQSDCRRRNPTRYVRRDASADPRLRRRNHRGFRVHAQPTD